MINAVIQNVNNGFITMIKVPKIVSWHYVHWHFIQFSTCLYPLPTKNFCRFLWSSISTFYFNLFSALKNCPFGLETAGAEFEVLKILCQDILQNLMQKQHIVIVKYGAFQHTE